MILTSEIRNCPVCDSTDWVRDYDREETYCSNCGLVLSSAVQWNGNVKTENVIPFSTPVEVRRGIHIRRKPIIITSKTKKYRHNIPDSKLMIKGHK